MCYNSSKCNCHFKKEIVNKTQLLNIMFRSLNNLNLILKNQLHEYENMYTLNPRIVRIGNGMLYNLHQGLNCLYNSSDLYTEHEKNKYINMINIISECINKKNCDSDDLYHIINQCTIIFNKEKQ